MRTLRRVALVAVPVALAAVLLGAPVVSDDPAPDGAPGVVGPGLAVTPVATAPPDCPASWRAVRLKCKHGAEGIATGSYGGTEFFVSCDVPDTRICTASIGWQYVMEGTSADGQVVRCADSGFSLLVNESCGPLRLIIN